MKNDVYERITGAVITLLEAGTVPWKKPWKGEVFAPQNYISRKAYRGMNALLLHAAGYASPFWLTFNQVKLRGGKVKKGEKAHPVVFWRFFEDEEETERRKVPLIRCHSVFNALQCEGIEVPVVSEKAAFVPIERCDAVVAGMEDAPVIVHGHNSASYSPLYDWVKMPDKAAFSPREAYYSVLFHELTHSTGHSTRLARKEVVESHTFGSDPYSREELVAEMGAAFLSGHCGIETATLDQSAAYIENWLARLKGDRKLVVRAAAEAQRAADFILNVKFDQPEAENPSPLEKAGEAA